MQSLKRPLKDLINHRSTWITFQRMELCLVQGLFSIIAFSVAHHHFICGEKLWKKLNGTLNAFPLILQSFADTLHSFEGAPQTLALRLSSSSTASFGLSGKWSCILLTASISIVLKPESCVTVMGGAFSHSACLMSLGYKLKEKNEKKHRLENLEHEISLAFSCWCKHYFCLALEICY